MRNIVKVYQPTVSTDSTGQETYDYAFRGVTYASYERDSFRKDETGYIQASGSETVTFKCRYTNEIGYNTRLEFNGLTYRVIEVDNYMNLRHELRVKCVAVDL